MPLFHLSEEDFLQLGLQHVTVRPDRLQGIRRHDKLLRFFSSFGVGPAACSAIFDDFQTTTIPEARIDGPDCTCFLMALSWMKTCMMERQIAGFFDVTEKSARLGIWKHVRSLQALKGLKIIWPENVDEDFLASVDGVHCRVNEPRRWPSSRWCSHKFKGPGVACEIAISIQSGACIWIKGPFMGGTKDLEIFLGRKQPVVGNDNELHIGDEDDDEDDDVDWQPSLIDVIPEGKLVCADEGCIGAPADVVSLRNACDSDEVKQFKKRVGARHETFNGRLKSFSVLDNRFRHDLVKHKVVFEAACVLVQHDLENGRPLFQL